MDMVLFLQVSGAPLIVEERLSPSVNEQHRHQSTPPQLRQFHQKVAVYPHGLNLERRSEITINPVHRSGFFFVFFVINQETNTSIQG